MEAVRQTEVRARTLTQDDVVWLMTATLVLLGLALRARGFLFNTIPFWEDEAAWAMRLVDLPLSEHLIRPLGFMAVSKALAEWLSPSETVLRALPWFGGVATLLMASPLANRLFTSTTARLFFVAVIALHPGAIDLAKEFKPYSVGLALHLGVLLLTLRYLDTAKRSLLAGLLVALMVGTLFSQDIVFTYPVVFGLLFFDALRARRTRQLATIVLAGVATLGLIATLYVCIWSKAVGTGDATTDHWGKKYDVFYVQSEGQGPSHLLWTANRVGDLAAVPGMRRESWTSGHLSDSLLEELRMLDSGVWKVLVGIGIGVLLYRRRWREAALLTAPLAFLVAFNAGGFWPLGAFRTNLFALVYTAGLAAAAFDRQRAVAGAWDFVPVGALVVVPFLILGKSTHGTKSCSMTQNSAFPDAIKALAALREDKSNLAPADLVALDSASCAPWRYYTHYHPRHRRVNRIARHFDAECMKSVPSVFRALHRALKAPDERAFVLLSMRHWEAEVRTHLPADLVIDGETYVGKRDQVVLRIRKQL